MASKVNVKFVVVLGLALTLVLAGMAGVFYFVLKKSGEDWARRGDEAMAAGDYALADEAYSTAVNHDRQNLVWLRKWQDAMEHVVIENEHDFEDKYIEYRQVVRQIAHMGRTADLEAHKTYLDMVAEGMSGSRESSAWRGLLTEARASQAFFDGGTPPQPGVTAPEEWHTLYRYSGMALGMLYALKLTETEDEVAQAERDLRLAVAADASDAEAAVELSQFYLLTSDRRRTEPPVDLAASERYFQQGRAVLSEALERDPQNVDAAIGLLGVDYVQAGRDLGARLGGQRAAMADLAAMRAPFAARLDAIAAEIGRRASAGVPIMTLERFAQAEMRAAPADQVRRSAELAEAGLEARPQDVHLLMMLANLRRMRGEHREAIGAMQRLVDLPIKPLGMEGWHLLNSRIGARLTQAEAALSLYEAEREEPARERALAEAKGYREALAALVPADSPHLLKIDARTAYLEGRWQEAERLLIATNQRTGGSDPEVTWWLAQTEISLGKLGEARRLLEALDELAPDNPRYMVAMAGVEIELRNLEAARGIARELMQLFPEDPEVQRIVREIEGTDNPVRAAYERYRATAEGGNGVLGDPEAALGGLRADFESSGHDPQIGQMLVQAYMGRREVAEALWAAERILESHPDQTGFQRIADALRHGEYLPAQVEIITTGPWPEVEKATMLWVVYKQEGMEQEAAAQMEAARRADPSSPIVIDLMFRDALARRDMAALNRVVEEARRHNTDGQEGETYAMRALIAESKHREAVTLGERLVTRSPNDANLWYLLGVERMAVGRLDEAESALRRSIEISPNNVLAVMELCGLLSARGQDAAALTVANAAEPFGRMNLEFVHMLLALEARAGNRQAALEQREALRERQPELLGNNVALAELYMDLGRWVEARALIDEMRAAGDQLGLVNLDARWHADQGDFDGASAAFTDYIASEPEVERPTQPYIAWAAFMQSREQFTRAEAALDAGRARQDPAVMECDRALGDLMTSAQRVDEAAEAYRRVVEGNADTPDMAYRLRLVESLLNLERYDDAREHLGALPASLAASRNVLLLTAELERKQGDRAAAGRTLDESVRLFPDDAVVYYQRAEFLLDDEARLMDALADFDTAIRKDPMFWQALRNRSGVYRRLGRMEEAVADLRTAVVAAGTDGEAITHLLGEMMNLRRTPEAVSAADEAVAQRPTDVVFLQRVAGVFAGRGEWSAAARFHQRAFEVRPEVPVAQEYLDALLNQRPPQTRTAEDVLNRLGAQVLTSPGLLSASTMVHVQRSRMQDAERDATAAFDLVSGNPGMLMVWHTTMTRAFGESAGYQAYLRRLAASKAVTPLKDWPVLFLAMSQSRDQATSAMAIEALNALSNTGEPVEVRLAAMRSIGTTVYGFGDHSQAAEIWRAALQVFPDDWEMNNNLAYVLTEHLGQAEEALPFARKALELNPRASSVQDTVGWTLHKAGNHEEALEHLWIAARLSRDAAEQAGVVQHILAVEVARGEKANAERWLTYLDRLIAESPWLGDSVRAGADEWRGKIGSLP